MSNLGQTINQAMDVFTRMKDSCVECGTCTTRCDLLEEGSWHIHKLCEASIEALDGVDDIEGLRHSIEAHNDLYHFIRCCEECNRCTVHCPQDLQTSDLWRPWRELVRTSGHIGDDEVSLIKVDHTWHTFSVFRAVNDIDYSDLPSVYIDPLDGAQDDSIATPLKDATLFFPGCTLCSYAPDLTRTAFAWLDDNVGPALFSEQCCAWPLECVGEIKRTVAWRERLVAKAHQMGVKRIVTVCPGCERQLAAGAAVVAPDIQFVSFARLLVEAGVRVDESMVEGCALPITVVDSCNDRDGTHGDYVRQLFENVESRPFPCTGKDAWCCGAGGNVASYDEALPRKRTQRSFSLCERAGANTLVTACPTCAYTYAFERWQRQTAGDSANSPAGDSANSPANSPANNPVNNPASKPPFTPESINYLEVVFGQYIDWPVVFGKLADMWQGEHASWVEQQLS